MLITFAWQLLLCSIFDLSCYGHIHVIFLVIVISLLPGWVLIIKIVIDLFWGKIMTHNKPTLMLMLKMYFVFLKKKKIEQEAICSPSLSFYPPLFHQSSQTHRTPVPSLQRRCSPANQSSGPPSVLRTASFPASLPTMPLSGTDPHPQGTAPMRSMAESCFFTCTELEHASRGD